jgi:hypothetical protein
MVVAMDSILPSLRALHPLLEIAGPLLLGAVAGTLFKTFVFPRMLERLGRYARWVTSPANILLNLMGVAVLLGLAVACHTSNAAETLEWLRAHPGWLPVQPTPSLLQYLFSGATFFCGYHLANFPSEPSSQ